MTTKAEVIERLPFEQYRQLPGMHSSSLKHALVSGLAYQHYEQNGWPDADKFRLGRAGHTGILEPQRFLSDYVQWETQHADGKKRIRSGHAWEEFKEANAGKTILTPEQFEIAVAVRDIVRDHPVAGPLVRKPGRSELTIRWRHERTGADCKARLDRVTAGEVIDIKMTADPSPRAFGNIAARLGYHVQGAFYRDAATALDGVRRQYKIIAVQSVAPHDVVVYDLGDDVLAEGQEQYERAIDVVLGCRSKQQWPGAATEHEIPLFLPAWALADAAADAVSDANAIDLGTETIQ